MSVATKLTVEKLKQLKSNSIYPVPYGLSKMNNKGRFVLRGDNAEILDQSHSDFSRTRGDREVEIIDNELHILD